METREAVLPNKPVKRTRSLGTHAGVCLLLAALSLAVFLQIRHHDAVSYDDPIVTENRHIQQGLSFSSIVWAFTDVPDNMPYWVPVVILSHMADFQLFGDNFGHHHLTSLLFHVLSGITLFLALSLTTGRSFPAGIAAMLFSIHPLNVEPVAWLATRNSVLAVFFGLLAVAAYLYYAHGPSWRRYATVLLMFVLALASKSEIAPLIAVFCLLDFWPLGRAGTGGVPARRLVLEKIPFLATVGCALLTGRLLGAEAGSRPPLPGPGEWFLKTASSYLTAIGRLFWPVDLTLIRPAPPGSESLWPAVAGVIILAVVTVVVIRARRSRPYLLTGWFWFVFCLAPVAVMMAGSGRVLADRHTYLPAIGLFIMAGWIVADLAQRFRRFRPAVLCVTAPAIIALALVSHAHVRHFRDSETLYRHAAALHPGNIQAVTNLADTLLEKGRIDEAIAFYRQALSMDPENALVHNNLGAAFLKAGDRQRAAAGFRQALKYDPGHPMAGNNLGNLLVEMGRTDEAIACFEKTLTPDNPFLYKAHNNIATAFARKGEFDKAVFHLRQALAIQPDYATARENLVRLLMMQQQGAAAIGGDGDR
ncbi:tetratricopeptide repeat protein [Desulfosudis oleivorans]|uniref:TPR repeat-containing protein n=1 Tax=Desulfosudis oleivorans (strain DSM 6200 / JCM 39069 / Hxd3) TaxID=96561 RepID=A8ZVN1_DESOH|nr:tetratricopeptide repeat protein [Desulfosudis oleivorans]ABW68218.1 TPR repeat-containing protein [Desulfosudis oleivorans Hxd3]